MVFLASGAIPLMRDGPLSVGRTALAVVGIALAALSVWFGALRARRTLQVHPASGRKIVASPRLEVFALGWATAGFAAIIIVILML